MSFLGEFENMLRGQLYAALQMERASDFDKNDPSYVLLVGRIEGMLWTLEEECPEALEDLLNASWAKNFYGTTARAILARWRKKW